MAEVRTLTTVAFVVDSRRQLCEKQESCRNAVVELLDQFTPFISIQDRVKELKERVETQEAVRAMLTLIDETSKYIIENIPSGIAGMSGPLVIGHCVDDYPGGLFGDAYQRKLSEVKASFAQAKEAFDRSIQLEMFKAVLDTSEFFPSVTYLYTQ